MRYLMCRSNIAVKPFRLTAAPALEIAHADRALGGSVGRFACFEARLAAVRGERAAVRRHDEATLEDSMKSYRC